MPHPDIIPEPAPVTLEQALAAIGTAVYQATGLAEDLEHSGKIQGNGHHLRQQMALKVQTLLYDAWGNDNEKMLLSPTHPVKDQD